MWNERYGAPGYAYGTAPNDFLVSVAARLPPRARVVSLAEGEGRNAVFLAEAGHSVVAIDSSSVGLDKARALAAERGVAFETVVADLANVPHGVAEADVVISIWAHVPPPLRRDLHVRVQRLLRPGGLFVVEAYHPAQTRRSTGGPRDKALCLTADQLREELPLLDWLILEETTRAVHEGVFHDGISDVVCGLGRLR
jgi:SAM-dependent methyltransferase